MGSPLLGGGIAFSLIITTESSVKCSQAPSKSNISLETHLSVGNNGERSSHAKFLSARDCCFECLRGLIRLLPWVQIWVETGGGGHLDPPPDIFPSSRLMICCGVCSCSGLNEKVFERKEMCCCSIMQTPWRVTFSFGCVLCSVFCVYCLLETYLDIFLVCLICLPSVSSVIMTRKNVNNLLPLYIPTLGGHTFKQLQVWK